VRCAPRRLPLIVNEIDEGACGSRKSEVGITKTIPKSEIQIPNSEGGLHLIIGGIQMFLSRKLTNIEKKLSQGICSFSPEEVNDGIDALGLPFGFKYSQRFLFKAFELYPTVEKIGDVNYRVPSESTEGQFYNVCLNPFHCDCPAFQRFKVGGQPFCKHVAAAMLKDQDVEGMEFEEFMERRNDGNYKWGQKPSLVSVFSSSQLDTYSRCPAQYYFRHIKKLPDYGNVSSSLVFDRCLKATIYAGFGYEPNPDIPLEEQWKPELSVAVEAFEAGLKVDEVFTESFQWLCADIEKSASVEWTDELEENLMLKQGRTLVKDFSNEFGEIEAEPLVSMRTMMVDKTTGEIVAANGTPVDIQATLDLVSKDGVIFKLKTSSRSVSNLSYDWSLDLQWYAYEQLRNQAPAEIKVVNFVRTKKPKMQVLSAPQPRISRTLAICNSVIASINAGSFYPNAKNVYGCSKCGYSSECEKQW
jgi:hypothetical protein